MAHPLHRRDWNAPELDAFIQSLDDRMADVLRQVTEASSGHDDAPSTIPRSSA